MPGNKDKQNKPTKRKNRGSDGRKQTPKRGKSLGGDALKDERSSSGSGSGSGSGSASSADDASSHKRAAGGHAKFKVRRKAGSAPGSKAAASSSAAEPFAMDLGSAGPSTPTPPPSQMISAAVEIEDVAPVDFATNLKSKKGFKLERRASAGNIFDLEDPVFARFSTNTLQTRGAEFLRVALWNIQDFGGGPSGSWPSIDEPPDDDYTTWLDAHPEIADIEMPPLPSRPKRRKALVKALREKSIPYKDDAVINYHEQVLHVCALADHLATLNYDILIALEVKQRASPPAQASDLNSRGMEARKIFFLYGVWSAVYGLPQVTVDVLNEIGFGRAADGTKLVNTTEEEDDEFDDSAEYFIEPEQADSLAAAYVDGRKYLGLASKSDPETTALGEIFAAFLEDVEIPEPDEEEPDAEGGAGPSTPKTKTELSDEALDDFLPDDTFFLLLAFLFAHRTIDSKRKVIGRSFNYPILPPKSMGTVSSSAKVISAEGLDELDQETKNFEELIASMKGLWNTMMRGRSFSQSCKIVLAPPLPPSKNKKVFVSLVAVLNKRLAEQGQPPLRVILKPESFNGAEALGFATQAGCDVDVDNIKQHFFKDASTYQRPLHVIPVAKGSLRAHIIAGHAPAPNHWAVGKSKATNQKVVSWFEEANRIAGVLGAGGHPVLFAGDLNISEKNAIGHQLLDACWLPKSGAHATLKTSYARTKKKKGAKTKWSEAYDKVLLLEASTTTSKYALSWLRDERWATFADARKYSDHSFVVADLEKCAGASGFAFSLP